MRASLKRMHPWHDAELGAQFPKVLTAVVEIPKGSAIQYKIDEKTGLLRISEALASGAHYPANYGSFPRTLAADGDALDVFIYSRAAYPPLTLVQVRPLGGIRMTSAKKGPELKIIAVHIDDPEVKDWRTLGDVPRFEKQRLQGFLENYKVKKREKKRVQGFFAKDSALALLRRSQADYKQHFL